MREAGIAMRTIDAVWVCGDLADEDLKRMADAAARIAGRNAKLRAAELDSLKWLSKQRSEVGLACLATELGEDRSNLLKVISGSRRLSSTLTAKIQKLIM